MTTKTDEPEFYNVLINRFQVAANGTIWATDHEGTFWCGVVPSMQADELPMIQVNWRRVQLPRILIER